MVSSDSLLLSSLETGFSLLSLSLRAPGGHLDSGDKNSLLFYYVTVRYLVLVLVLLVLLSPNSKPYRLLMPNLLKYVPLGKKKLSP